MNTLNLRIPATARNLIDRAAESSGKTRTDFILEAARRAAEDVLLDRTIFAVSPEVYAEFLARLDAAPQPNELTRMSICSCRRQRSTTSAGNGEPNAEARPREAICSTIRQTGQGLPGEEAGGDRSRRIDASPSLPREVGGGLQIRRQRRAVPHLPGALFLPGRHRRER